LAVAARRLRGSLLPALGAALMMSGCGGGSDGGAQSAQSEPCVATSVDYCPSYAFQDPLGIALTFAWWSGQCTREVVCRSDLADQPETDLQNGIVREDYATTAWLNSVVDDREANNGLDTAVPFVLQSRSGVRIDGTVDARTDGVDVFVFVSESVDDVAAYICASADDCLSPQSTSPNLYLSVYDEDRNLIATTRDLIDFEDHAIRITSSRGSLFYVAVTAVGDGPLSYRLRITD
jgi:hypothetical protein